MLQGSLIWRADAMGSRTHRLGARATAGAPTRDPGAAAPRKPLGHPERGGSDGTTDSTAPDQPRRRTARRERARRRRARARHAARPAAAAVRRRGVVRRARPRRLRQGLQELQHGFDRRDGRRDVRSGASSGSADKLATLVNTAITAEALAVTYLSGLLQNNLIPKQFTKVIKAANQAEYDHFKALQSLGAKPLTTKFWAPNAFFDKSEVFATIETAETLFVNAYLIAMTEFAKAGKSDQARYAGEILGTEAEHLALSRFAQGKLPNNDAFMGYEITTIDGIVKALGSVGVGFGKKGSKPGKFYEFPGQPPSSTTTHITSEAVA